MIKKLNLIIEGNCPSINELLPLYLKSLRLQNTKAQIVIINGLKNYKTKPANNFLILSAFDERKVLQQIEGIQSNHPELKIILYSNFQEADFICKLLNNGVKAHISTMDNLLELQNAIEHLMENKEFHSHQTDKIISDYYSNSQVKKAPNNEPLTATEKIVFKFLCQGKTCPEIAEILFKSIPTIYTHKQHIYNKIGVSNISEFHVWAHKNNFDFES